MVEYEWYGNYHCLVPLYKSHKETQGPRRNVMYRDRYNVIPLFVQRMQESERLIQGVTPLNVIKTGGDFLGRCDQKSSYKHVSDSGRLRSYDRFKLRIEGNDY
jgi:hypothetical protein